MSLKSLLDLLSQGLLVNFSQYLIHKEIQISRSIPIAILVEHVQDLGLPRCSASSGIRYDVSAAKLPIFFRHTQL